MKLYVVPIRSEQELTHSEGIEFVFPVFKNKRKAHKFRAKRGGSKDNSPIIVLDCVKRKE